MCRPIRRCRTTAGEPRSSHAFVAGGGWTLAVGELPSASAAFHASMIGVICLKVEAPRHKISLLHFRASISMNKPDSQRGAWRSQNHFTADRNHPRRRSPAADSSRSPCVNTVDILNLGKAPEKAARHSRLPQLRHQQNAKPVQRGNRVPSPVILSPSTMLRACPERSEGINSAKNLFPRGSICSSATADSSAELYP